MELKAYKLLAELQGRLLARIKDKIRNKVEYCKDKPDEIFELMEYISNPAKWDYCGLLSKEDKAVLETIEFLLDDKMENIRKYGEWKPMER